MLISTLVPTFNWCFGCFGHFSSGSAKELLLLLPVHCPALAHDPPEAACIPEATLLSDGYQSPDIAASSNSHHSQHLADVTLMPSSQLQRNESLIMKACCK